jgi:branched-chain amino acid transport system permease protein
VRLFLLTTLNGLTLAALYFLVASGFTLVFGLMRNVNLAHGSLYLLGAYIGYDVADASGSWYLGVAGGFLSMALAGLLMQLVIFRHMAGQDLRQTLVTIGLSIVLADLMLAIWGGSSTRPTGSMARCACPSFGHIPFIASPCWSLRSSSASGSGCSSTARASA